MRYANLKVSDKTSSVNIGDLVQIEAIDYIYSRMGVDSKDIVYISTDDISRYRGEKLILPMNFPLFGIYNLSADIRPVYLGVSMIDGCGAIGLKMKENEPIGCRDDYTYNEITKYGINGYHAGCLTIVFPKREKDPANGKTYIVGINDSIYDELPEYIRKSAIRKEHIMYHGLDEALQRSAVMALKEYRECASLVITSKIHCAQPCIAMGIPVIFICEDISFRYSVIKNYIPIYRVEDLHKGKVDWNPRVVEVEKLKQEMISNAIERITWAKNQKDEEQSEYLSNNGLTKRERMIDGVFSSKSNVEYSYNIDMIDAMKKYIHSRYKCEDEFKYAIWGINQFTYKLVNWIREKYPLAILDKVADRDKGGVFWGKTPERIESLIDYTHPVFVTATSVVAIVKDLFETYHIKKYVACYNGIWIEDGKVYSK